MNKEINGWDISKYKITEQWNIYKQIPSWTKLFKEEYKSFTSFTPRIKNVLEIGCFEGATAMWLCEVILQPGTTYEVIDTFQGSDEDGMNHIHKELNKKSFIEQNFLYNISKHPQISWNIYKDYSQHILPSLVHKYKKKYDLIFVDASHKTDDTFVDGYYAHQLLNDNGIIIFDDYGWVPDTISPHRNDTPKAGIDFFFEVYSGKYAVMDNGYQKIGIKLAKE